MLTPCQLGKVVIDDVEWIMIAFIMGTYCISTWGEQMFIVTLLFAGFFKRRLKTV